MDIQITPNTLSGVIEISASKSVAHRIMICACLSSKNTLVNAKLAGTDVVATADCLRALGGGIEIGENSTLISPISQLIDGGELFCKDSGSTFRFMLPVACALGACVTFSGTDRLASRPVAELMNVLSSHGIQFSSDTLPFSISGKLSAGRFEIEAGVSSQYITGLLLALPLLDGDSTIVLKGRAVSTDYISITLDVLAKFGIEILKTDDGFFVRGRQRFSSPMAISCEGDWSSACFPAVCGLLGEKVGVENISSSSLQGDKAIVEIIRKIGGSAEKYVSTSDKECYTFFGGDLCCGTFETGNIPDTVPILAVACAFCKGRSELVGISRLKDKESDRLAETIAMLSTFGIESYCEGDSLFVVGGKPHGGKYHVPDDHRMAMASIVLASFASDSSEIFGIDCIAKSYPHFMDDFARLGGIFDVLSV